MGTSRRWVLVARRNKVRDNNEDIALEEINLVSILKKNFLGMTSRPLVLVGRRNKIRDNNDDNTTILLVLEDMISMSK